MTAISLPAPPAASADEQKSLLAGKDTEIAHLRAQLSKAVARIAQLENLLIAHDIPIPEEP